MDEFQLYKQKVDNIEKMLMVLVKSDRYTFDKDLQVGNGRNIILGTETGTILGTESTQKLGLWGADPIDQPTAPSLPSGGSTQDTEARAWISSMHNIFTNSGFTGL